MNYGAIKLGSETTQEHWLAVIEKDERLVNVPSRSGINPFTQEPVEFKPPPTAVQVSVNGENCGSIWWNEDGSAGLNVEVSDAGMPTVQAITTALGGDYFPE